MSFWDGDLALIFAWLTIGILAWLTVGLVFGIIFTAGFIEPQVSKDNYRLKEACYEELDKCEMNVERCESRILEEVREWKKMRKLRK